MESQKLTNLIQILTAFTVVVGLGLVVWELRQTRQFMEFELVDRTFAELLATRRSEIGENPMASYARACSGESLSLEDRLVLDNYFLLLFGMASRQFATLDQLNFQQRGGSRISATILLEKIFALEEGKLWFESMEDRALSNRGPAMLQVLDLGREMLNRGVPLCSMEQQNRE